MSNNDEKRCCCCCGCCCLSIIIGTVLLIVLIVGCTIYVREYKESNEEEFAHVKKMATRCAVTLSVFLLGFCACTCPCVGACCCGLQRCRWPWMLVVVLIGVVICIITSIVLESKRYCYDLFETSDHHD